jgi:hypothetical protein
MSTIKNIFCELVFTQNNKILVFFWFSFLVILILLGSQDDTYTLLSVSKSTLVSIATSIVASVIFYLILEVINAKKNAENKLVKNFGLQNIFEEKILAKENYAKSIKKSKCKIWAIGKSQSSFISQHAEIINNLITKNKNIEIKIIFWDCQSTLNINNSSKHICCIQDAIKNKSIKHLSSTECDNETIKIKNRINDLKTTIDIENQKNITIGFLNIPTNFSCLITDDDTYFFPFLSNEKSNKSPMIQCSSNKKLGESIIRHYEEIFKEDTFIYNSKLLSEHE